MGEKSSYFILVPTIDLVNAMPYPAVSAKSVKSLFPLSAAR
jgi:hypothetical protein